MTRKVYIGIGHGGSDAGAVSGGLKEKDLALVTGLACYNTLKRHGVNAKISRTTDKDSTIASKVKECNAFAGELDYCLDIHYNAGGGDGCEVYYFHDSEYSKSLAEDIIAGIKTTGQNSRGVKTKTYTENGRTYDYFGMIRDTVPIAVLVECAFMDTSDIQIANTKAKQEAMGVAIAKGILKHLGIAYKEESKPSAPSQPTAKFKVGDKVKVLKAVQYDNGKSFAAYYNTYDVIQVSGNRVVIGIGKTVTAAVHADNLAKVGASAPTAAIKAGDKVRVKQGAKDYSGNSLASFVYQTVYTVQELSGKRAVIGLNGAVTAAISVDNLYKA